MKKRKDYETGYGKPPKSGQFRKGQSGNPKGRPKGTRDFNTDLRDVLNTRVAVTESGKPKKVTSQKATLMRLREKALNGDHKAMTKLLDLARELNFEEWTRKTERQLTLREDDILERFKAAVLKKGDGGE